MKPQEHLSQPPTANAIFHPGLLIIQSSLSLMLGIGAAMQFPTTPLYLPVAIVIVSAFAAIAFRAKRQSHLFILVFVTACGMVLGVQKLQLPEAPHIRGLISHPTNLTCSGVIQETLASNSERVKLILNLDTIYTPEPVTRDSQRLQDNLFSTQTFGTMQLSMAYFDHQHLQPGDPITVQANVSPPRGFANPGGFNLPFYLQSQNIFISGWVPRPDDIIRQQTTTSTGPRQLIIKAEKIRSRLISFYNASLSPGNASLYRALITGDRSGLASETQEMFKNLGIYHLLAISGLHMGLLAGFIMWLTTKFMRLFPRLLLYIPAKQGAAALAMLPVIFYCFISGLHPPAVRACLMTIVLFSAFIFRKQWHGPTAIATAALFILIHNPLLLAMASFQLSFIAVTAIVFILPLLKSLFFAEENQPSLLTTLKGTLLSGFLISLVASVATLPLLLFHFNRVSLVSPITTLIMEPLLCLWALGFGLAGSFFIFLSPSLAESLLHIGSFGFDCSLWIGNNINQIPLLSLWLPSPPLWKIVLFYTSLPILFFLRNKRALLIFTCSLILLLLPQARDTTVNQVTMIDVGKGNSSLIECDSGETILIDCGGPHGARFNIGRQVIAPFLWSRQIRSLDLLILSHSDLDHYSGATFLLKHFQPKAVWLPYINADNEEWQTMIATARQLGVTIRIPNKNEHYPLKNGQHLFNISGTNLDKRNWSQNDQSLVIRFTSGPYSFLFPGDIEKQGEMRLLQTKAPLQATVIVAPHHGSKSSSTRPFLNMVTPQYVVFSSSLYGNSLFPAPVILERYTSMHSIPLQTAKRGAITFRLHPDELEVATVLPPEP